MSVGASASDGSDFVSRKIGTGVGPIGPNIGIPTDSRLPLRFRILQAMGLELPASDRRHFNSSILTERAVDVVQSPALRYPIEPSRLTAMEIYTHFLDTQKALGTFVDRENSPIYNEMRECLNWILERAGISADNVELDILKSPVQNAFIIHHEDIGKPHVFVTTALIASLAESLCLPRGLRQEHVRYVMGHEMTHFQEGHYDQVRARETIRQPSPGSDPIIVRQISSSIDIDSLKDRFFERAFTRDQELRADEQSIRWCAESRSDGDRVNPVGGIEVLDHFAEGAKRQKHANATREKSSSKTRFSLLSWAATELDSTHPGSEGRASRGRGTVRQVEVERSAEFGIRSAQRHWRETSRLTNPHKDPEVQITTVQDLMRELDRMTSPVNINESAPIEKIDAFVRSRIDFFNINNYEGALNEIKHLQLFLQGFVRVHAHCLPFEPYDRLKVHPSDDPVASLGHGMERDQKEKFEALMLMLETAARDLHSNMLKALEQTGESSQEMVAAVSLQAFFCCGGMYHGQWGDELLFKYVVPALQNVPLAAPDLINRYGLQFFDFRGISCEWDRALLEGAGPVGTRGVWFAQLFQDERVDLRTSLLRVLLQNSLIDNITTLPELNDFLSRMRTCFGNDPIWRDGDVQRVLGSEISFWLTNTYESDRPLENAEFLAALNSIRQIESADQGTTDYIYLEAMRPCLEKTAGTLEERCAWLERTLPPGRLRDLALCELMEEETSLFKTARKQIYDPGQPREEQNHSNETLHRRAKKREKDISTNPGERPLEETELRQLDKKFLAEYHAKFSQAARLFNCDWFDLDLVRGHMASVQLEDPRMVMSIDNFDGEVRSVLPMPLHSPLLSRFCTSYYYSLMAPQTHDVNTLRYYVRMYITVSLLAYEDHDLERKPDFIPLMPYLQVRNTRDLHDMLNVGPFQKLVAELPRQYRLPLALLTSKGPAQVSPVELRAAASTGADPINCIARARCLVPSDENRRVDVAGHKVSPHQPKSLGAFINGLPEGEFRDYLILRELARALETSGLSKLAAEITQFNKKAREARLADLRDTHIQKIRKFVDECSNTFIERSFKYQNVKDLLALLRSSETLEKSAEYKLSHTGTEQALKLETLAEVYENYPLYLKHRSGVIEASENSTPFEASYFNLQDIATEVGRMCLQVFHGGSEKNVKAFQSLSPGEKFQEICELFVYPSSERDSHLMKIFREGEKLDDTFHTSPLARQIYASLYSPYFQGSVGERIYEAEIARDPSIQGDFDRQFPLVMETHPAGSSRRERRLKIFFDGKPGVASCTVRTWEQRDRVNEALKHERETSGDPSHLLRRGGVQFLETAVNELNISQKERVDTILWMAGLREKSHLVNCYEALEGTNTASLGEELKRLTDDEKRVLIRGVLVGPAGVLKSDDMQSKKEFLDTLFFSVFRDASENRNQDNIRYFKAVYDTMLYHIEPERSADFLGNFLVAHLQGQSFNQQVKVFFESFGFVGVKTAQYLVSSTTMIPPEMREVLMDLTSRVEGPDCNVVFDQAEATYGPLARKFIAQIGNRVGGGSLMSFYEVTLADGREGVLGMLRPDIVQALPEDIVLVRRLIETMHEAPEIFGGKTISEDLNDNLVYMSLIETNLQRTAKLQMLMKQQIEELNGSPSVHVPEIWDRIRIPVEGLDGQVATKRIDLNQGPFIFMERAHGQTLDLYLKECEQHGTEGSRKRKEIFNKVADVFLAQITEHGLVHCDLHPGNILIADDGDKIKITILDIGLSTELDQDISGSIQKYLRIAIGHADTPGSEGHVGKALKKVFGLGEIDPHKGKRWIAESIEIFERWVDETWSEAQRAKATEMIWELMTDSKKSVQVKLSEIMDLTRELGLHFPREFYYMLRAVSIMDYMWSEVDWKRQASRFKSMGRESSTEPLPTLKSDDIDAIVDRVIEAADEVSLKIDESKVRDIIEKFNREPDLARRIQNLRSELSALATAENEEKVHEVLQLLADDQRFNQRMGLDHIAKRAKQFFALQRGEHEQNRDFGFLSPEPLAKGLARQLAYDLRFGSLSTVWQMNFYPGMPVRVVNERGTAVDQFFVNSNNLIHDKPEYLELSRIGDSEAFEVYCHMTSYIFGSPNSQSTSVGEEWDRSLRPIDAYLNRLSRPKEGISARTIGKLIENDETERIEGISGGNYVDAMSATGISPTVPLKGNASPWQLYQIFFNFLTDPKQNRDTTKFGKLVRDKSKSGGQYRVQIMVEDQWKELEECVLQAGETPAEYLRFMTDARQELRGAVGI